MKRGWVVPCVLVVGVGLGACGVDQETSKDIDIGIAGAGGAAAGAGGGTTAGTGSTSSSGKGGSAGAAGKSGGAGASGSPATDPCDKHGDGSYCGESIAGGEKGKLYWCESGVALSVATCKDGCVAKPGGAAVCQTDANEPCFNDADGDYCGETIGGKPNTVVTCKGKVSVGVVDCPGGCADKAGGKSYCLSDATEPCFNDPDGTYCGDLIGAANGKGKLYTCAAHATVVVKDCPSGCVDKPGGTDVCQSDANEPCFNDGDGFYCGAAIGGDTASLYHCVGHATAEKTHCDNGCMSQPTGVPDNCAGTGQVSCGMVQWWDVPLTYGPYMSNGWWDTDLAVSSSSKVQLRHDSKLIAHGVYGWGWMPTFIDQTTGKKFRFLHLRPQNQYTTEIGKVYPAGTLVGISGGDTADTGKPTYSTGAHLCVQTVEQWLTVFPKGKDPCN